MKVVKPTAGTLLFLAMMGAAVAAGPRIVNSGEMLDAEETAKILRSDAFVTRSIRQTEGPASVALRIPFGFGSAKVPESAMPQLEAMSKAIRQVGVKIMIEGHTDSTGNPDYNRKLSEKRASAVRDVMVATYGVDPNELAVTGMGKDRPLPDIAPTSSGNRRVEFRVDR